MKKIVIDARESGTSTGRYVDKLIEYLAKLQPAFEIVVLTKSHRLAALRELAPAFDIQAADFKEFTFAEQLGLKKRLNQLRPDLVHFSMTQQPIWYHHKKLTTIHDLTTARFHNPDKHVLTFFIKQLVYRHVIKSAARKSRVVFTPTEFVKDDVVKFTGVSPDKVMVTYEAADAISDKAEVVPGLVSKRFLLYVGRPTPHKNLERLIDAFRTLRQQHPELYLVLAGKKDRNYERIEDMVRTSAIKGVYFTDFVSEGRLRWLYEHCAAYVFPSLSEGFGLPGLEAMAHGAPVVSSNATCLPEVYGQAARYFDPTDTVSLADAINEVLSDKNLRRELTENGRKQVKKYSWRRMAEQTLAAYEKMLSN
ncbi:MAG TPA: glycosyltransferase family 1 protein [Candidatus Saccharimonadales bacterium]|nr:glycosyltransferase family 1 protein [Candidatus Saccharimonadales bacterium]